MFVGRQYDHEAACPLARACSDAHTGVEGEVAAVLGNLYPYIIEYFISKGPLTLLCSCCSEVGELGGGRAFFFWRGSFREGRRCRFARFNLWRGYFSSCHSRDKT